MPNRMGNFVAALVVGPLAGIALFVSTDRAAADDCLAGPKGAAPQGSHWYYRVDRAAKRNCWYVRAQSATPNATRKSSVAEAAPAPQAPLQPAVANARAEAGAADVAPPDARAHSNPADSSAGSSVDNGEPALASRWPDQAAAAEPSAEPAAGAEQNATTPAAVADLPSSPTARPVAQAAVPTLLLVMIGALAAAGLMAASVFWFGSRRAKTEAFQRDQAAPWDRIEAEPLIVSPPLASRAPIVQAAAQHDRHEAVVPDEIVQLLSQLSKEAPA